MLVLSHDEVVHGKGTLLSRMPGEREKQFANLRLTYAYHMTHPGKKLLFMGQDIGEYHEFNEKRAVEWGLLEQADHKKLNQMVADLNKFYVSSPALYEKDTSWEGFEWINCITPNACMLSYIRKTDDVKDMLVVVANFADARQEFRVGVPCEGKYREVFNTDDTVYGGSGIINKAVCDAMEMEWDGKPYAIDMVSAPLSISIFSYTPYTKAEKAEIERKRAEERRLAKEAEERRLAEEEAARTAKAAAEAKEQAKRAAAEAKELARRAAAEARESAKAAEALEKAAEAAAQKLQELTRKPKTDAKKSAAGTKTDAKAASGAKSAGRKSAADKKTTVKKSDGAKKKEEK